MLTNLTPISKRELPKPKPSLTSTWLACQACGGEHRQGQECASCHQKAEHAAWVAKSAAAVLEDLPGYLADRLTTRGFSKRELQAELKLIPKAITGAIPPAEMHALMSSRPSRGFGVGGSTGAGKTMALAALVKAHAEAEGRRVVTEQGGTKLSWLLWRSWPITAGWLRSNAVRDSEAVHAEIQALCEVPMLFLDDLGAERLKGDYSEDYARGELDLVIDTRYRAMLPTWFTTNTDAPGLTAIYGARLVSRLCGENPLHQIKGAQDLRLARKG